MKKTPLNDLLAFNSASNKKESLGNVACVTLGCAKNQLDSEVFLGSVLKAGYQLVDDLEDAEYIVVNTCGFINDALKESVDAVLDAADYKQDGKLKKLIVAGCMVSRYGFEKMKELFPEADAFLDTNDIMRLPELLASDKEWFDGSQKELFIYNDTMPRVISTGSHLAYVKLAEGCSRPCAFCMIPKIRGPLRSRPATSILDEVRALGEAGVKEIDLIGQDLTAYGQDNGEMNLAALLKEIDKLNAVPWVRLLYAYPVGATEELLSTMVSLPSVCNYFDVPLQHSSESVLKRMNRPVGKYAPRKLVEWIQSKYPEISLRTTFIVGFPGETEEDFKDLEAFVSEGHFSNVGVFTFSPEEEVPATKLSDQIDEEVKQERRERLMLAQQKVLEKRGESLIGKQCKVLVDGFHEETDLLLVGRTENQAPEVDGTIIINDSEIEEISAGDFVTVEITERAGYDFLAKAVSKF